jgi:hypothetical protein
MRRDGHEHFFLKNKEVQDQERAGFNPADPALGFLAELARGEKK